MNFGLSRCRYLRMISLSLLYWSVACFPTQALAQLMEIDFTKAVPVSEAYRMEFLKCDKTNTFRGQLLQKTKWCSRDKNNFKKFLKFGNDAILTVSKLGVDLDGSWYACNTPGMTDQCPTSLMLPYPAAADRGLVPVDSDRINYVVIPASGPNSTLGGEFRRRTKLGLRAVGVAFYKGAGPIPVIVADGGPFNKFGEGSMALHRALGRELCAERNSDGNCVKLLPAAKASIPAEVTIVFFLNSQLTELSVENIQSNTAEAALKRWNEFELKYRKN